MVASTSSGEENTLMFTVYAIYLIFTFIIVSVPEVICLKTTPKQKESVLFLSR